MIITITTPSGSKQNFNLDEFWDWIEDTFFSTLIMEHHVLDLDDAVRYLQTKNYKMEITDANAP